MASPGSDDGSSAAVCCMCGDHGLPHELFRCNLCRLRLQHRYCSDLYPRVPGPYRSCNWCLVREDGGGGGGGGGSPVKAAAAVGAERRPNGSRDDDDDPRDQGERPWCGGGCTRSAFSADPGKPVKKPKRGRARVAQRPAATMAPKKRGEVQQAGAGGRGRFRVKVRRYKLLAEVIC
ncbi:uncharacterized protein LOC120654118 [Panicum virgatum]|uniref:PHD-type zinc finger plants domain-containing protein n=1 Tax=Panicum virgatum TaxID=38727 RepID=A0A8T0WZ65_PANVG|nr:uncharacterized protein LOC120654118 [Panicum virgatum]KAG2651727.1 hypothetical protein PVAP13_1NG309500 [Panicum virgatum]